ncbi:hypothetical protein [Hymenobacter volaticus]|uniref:Uncharacterized protein n=1 Tax=Hymenobacter volaticus TaxID=2932254 RepID=A0ABY4G314_9BACT|nr:hypothetical protein [Hymenobacter volaticus]UOQ65260.1 hypothetical protein MUN86_17120 [Hymenobacter volaticus]
MRLYFKLGVISLLLLSSCQSARFIVPDANEYGVQAIQRPTASTDQTQPVLLAVLSKKESSESPQLSMQHQKPIAALPVGRLPMLSPDTSLNKTLPLVLSGKSDPKTTIVNSIGGAVTATGLGFIIARASADTPQTEWGGISKAMGVLGALLVVLVGVALLFFQGKNGRLRRLREARQAAKNPVVMPLSEDSSKLYSSMRSAEHRVHRSKSGLQLLGYITMYSGILILALSLLGGPPIGFLLAGVITILLGLILLVAGS